MSPEQRIDRLCDVFEAEWQKGAQPRIAEFIGRVANDEQTALFYELLLVELECRRTQGEHPSREEYLRQFPRFADEIEAASFRFGGAAFATSSGANDDSVCLRGRLPGSRVGHFELLERLGAGAMGEVWKAWDPQLKRRVAVKLPRVENLSDTEIHRFLREGRAAAQLRHPQLAAVYEVGREGDSPFIAAEYIEGEDLCEHFQSTKLKEKASSVNSTTRRLTLVAMADLCAEIAEALHHAHEQGVVHRDLKPANIIIDRAKRPHVIDFGLAKWSSDDRELTLQGELLGTPAYMSPEQAAGDAAKLDRRTDVYSLGIILYEMIGGRCPFVGECGSVIHQIIAHKPAPLRSLDKKLPRDLETICIKALEKDPSRRYATTQEMAVDLRRFARGEPILTRRAGPLEWSWRWLRRHPGAAAAIVAIALILTASGVIVRSLTDKNYRLQGYRPVYIESQPPGARLAFVPIDRRTGEPNPAPAGIVRPQGVTPLTVLLKPGDYFVEAVLPVNQEQMGFAEEYRTVLDAGAVSAATRKSNLSKGFDEDVQTLTTIKFRLRKYVTAKMVAISISDILRRQNPLLPKVLYVDAKERSFAAKSTSKPELPNGQNAIGIPLDSAMEAAAESGKRIPSAAEYEAIVAALSNNDLDPVALDRFPGLKDVFGGVAEWTTTRYEPPIDEQQARTKSQMQIVLKGYGDPDQIRGARLTPDGQLVAPPKARSPGIGFRGVHSGTPRFVEP